MDGWLDSDGVVVEFGAHGNFLGDWRMSMEGAPPLWLVLPLLMEFGFGQLFKWASQHRCYAPTVVSTNYWVLASILLLYLGLHRAIARTGRRSKGRRDHWHRLH